MATSRREGRPQTNKGTDQGRPREEVDCARGICEGASGNSHPALSNGGAGSVNELADKIVALESSREISAELFAEIRKLAEKFRTKVHRDYGRGK